MTYVIVALVAALLAAVAVKSMQKPESKRFGLKEAEAAAQYLGNDPAAAKPVMGVVCGVLGYKNAVDEDLQKLVAERDAEAAKRAEELRANVAEIKRLEAEIEKVMKANEDLHEETLDANQLVAEKAKVAALFKS